MRHPRPLTVRLSVRGIPVSEPRKRAAIEPVSTLITREEHSDQVRRPASTVLGAVFILARALAGLLWIGAFLLIWADLARDAELDAEATSVVAWVVSGASAFGVLILLVFAWLIWRGNNAARILVMSGLTLSIISAAVGYFAMGEEISIRTSLVLLGLDILVLLALSSRDSRAWARRRRRVRN